MCSLVFVAHDVRAQDDIAIDYDALKVKLSKARETMNHGDLASTYYALAKYEEEVLFDYEQSFDHYTSSLTYYKLISDTLQINDIQRKIAFRFKEANLYSDAIRIYEELLGYYESKNDRAQIMKTLSQLAVVYRARGDTELQQEYLNKAMAINVTLKDTVSQIQFLLADANRLLQVNALDSAVIISLRAFNLSNEVGDKALKSQALYDVAYVNKLKGNYDRAIKYFESGIKLLEYKAYDKVRLRFYKQLADCYSLQEVYPLAYNNSKSYAQLNDSILDKDRQEALNNANIRYQINEKNKDIQNLEKERNYAEEKNQQQRAALYILMIGLGLLLLLLYYSIQFYTQKIKTEHIISEQNEEINKQQIRVLEDKVKINGMQSMIEGQEKERERVAKDLHDSLGGLLSTIKLQFDSVKSKLNEVIEVKEFVVANELLDVAVEEIRTISRNMQPGALSKLGLIAAVADMINRFDNDRYPDIDFQYYNIPKKLDPTIALSIYRIVQELLHNAIKHAKANEILIQLNADGKELTLQFEDDGQGFSVDKKQSKGMGLENIKSRVNYLKGSLEIDSAPGQGTSYLIHVSY